MSSNILLFNGNVLPSLNLSDHFYGTYSCEPELPIGEKMAPYTLISNFSWQYRLLFKQKKKTSKKAALCIIKDSGPLESSERMSCICPETCASELAAVHYSAES